MKVFIAKIKMDLHEVVWEGVDWIDMAEDR
jgi:hypothetical protein